MKIFKKNFIVFILLIIAVNLSSCIGARELDTLGIVVSIGLDLDNGEVILTNEVINAAAIIGAKGSDNRENVEFVIGKGETVRDALSDVTLTFDRELYYPHNRLIIIGEDLAREGIGEYMDLLSRGPEQRELAFLLVAKGEKAYNIMGINSGIANSAGRYVFDILNGDLYNAQTRTLTIGELLRYYYRPKEGYIFGVVRSVEKPQINKMLPNKTLEVICVEGGAVFYNDKLKGYFSGDEMVGFNFLVDEMKSLEMVFNTPIETGDIELQRGTKGEYTTVRLYKSKTKLDVKLEEEKLHLYINVRISGSLIEDTHALDLSDPKVLKIVEKACAKSQKKIISNTLHKSQKELGVDCFSIGELVHRKYPKIWKEIKDDWTEIFKGLDHTIKVDVNIGETGVTNTPPNLRKGRNNE